MANFPPRAGSGNQPSSQAGGQPGSGLPAASPLPAGSGTATGMRIAGVRPCPSCSALVNVHATICPNCGEQIATREKTIRCRRCRQRASSNLVVCPRCGRDLQPAPSRWLTWGLPLLAVLLLSGIVVLRAGRGDPASWAQAQVDRVVRLVQSWGSRLQPDVTISMIPAGLDPNDPLVSQAAQAGADLSAAPESQGQVVDVVAIPAGSTPAGADAAVPAEPATATPPPATATPEPTLAVTATAAPTSTATGTATGTPARSAPTATAAAVRTLTRTIGTAAGSTVSETASLTLTGAGAGTSALTQSVSLLGLATPTLLPAQPAATPTPATSAATATPTPFAVHEVRRGDTLFEIAGQYDVAVEDLLAANGLTEDDVYTIQPGDKLNIPAPTPEGVPAATGPATGGAAAAPTVAPATYTVRAGDTMLAIALRNDVSVEDLLAANGMTIADARTLQPGDELVLPGPEGAATATPAATATVAATATAAPATAAPAIAASPSATPTPATSVRLDAPRLRAPENGTAVSCSGQGTLIWLQVPGVSPTDLYLVHLGYVNSVAAAGQEEVIWVISQQRPASATSWQLDNNLCGLAPNTAGKQWRWFVEVVEPTTDGLRPVSPASSVWGFTWQ